MERTYTGPLPRGRQHFPDDTHIDFTRGVAVEVTADQAKALSDEPDWHTPASKAAKTTPIPKDGD